MDGSFRTTPVLDLKAGGEAVDHRGPWWRHHHRRYGYSFGDYTCRGNSGTRRCDDYGLGGLRSFLGPVPLRWLYR